MAAGFLATVMGDLHMSANAVIQGLQYLCLSHFTLDLFNCRDKFFDRLLVVYEASLTLAHRLGFGTEEYDFEFAARGRALIKRMRASFVISSLLIESGSLHGWSIDPLQSTMKKKTLSTRSGMTDSSFSGLSSSAI